MKKLLALLLAVTMLFTLFAACSKKEPQDDGGKVSDNAGTPSSTVSDDATEPEELTEVTFWMFLDNANSSEDTRERIVAAVNEISETEIGVTVNIKWVAVGDYSSQLSLAVANKEVVDLAIYSYMAPMATYFANGACLDITDYVAEYGKDITEILGSKLDMTKYDGRLYGVCTYRNFNSNAYISFRTDALEAGNVTDLFNSMTTWTEYEEVLGAIYENANTYPLGGVSSNGVAGVIQVATLAFGGDSLSDSYFVDNLGDSLNVIACSENGIVSLLQEDEGIVNAYRMMADWYGKGYVWPDSAFSNEDGFALVGANTYAGGIQASQFGIENTASQMIGADVTMRMIAPGPVDMFNFKCLGSFVPSSSAEPEAAITFLNLMFTNADVMNLLIYGIEGENYIVNDAGEADFPEGQTVATCGYRQSEWWYGNNYLLYPGVGNGGDFRDRALENYNEATMPKFFSVSVDTTDHSALVAAINAVKGEYHSMMVSGMYTEAYYNEYIEKLYSAGVEDYIALFQSEVDDFMA